MSSRNRSTRFAPLAAAAIFCGIPSVQVARAQDAEPPGGSPSAAPSTDPNAPPPGAYSVAPPAIRQSDAASYKPYLLMPFIGVQSEQNDNSNTGPGLRVGGLFGGRINEQFSFNGELLFDWENLSNIPAGLNASAYFIQLGAAPLFHGQVSPTAEIVIGPKLGFFFAHASESGTFAGMTLDGSASTEGLVLGANLGAFFRLSDSLSLGGLFNFDYLRAEWCTVSQGDCTTSSDGIKVISFAGAAQF